MAQDLIILDRVMVIGNPDNVKDIPGSAYYLDKQRLSQQSYNNIHRILQEVPGVNVQEEEGYGLRPNIGMRGTGSSRTSKITVMEDGVLMAPAPYAAPDAYYFPTAGRMQGLEVRKGSSQIKHGPITTGGAINMLSTAIPYGFGGRAHLFVGENGTRNTHAYLGDAYRNFGWLIETHTAHADGFKHLDGGGNTGFDKKDYLGKFRFNTSRDARAYHELQIKLGQTDEISNDTYLGLTDQDFARTPYRRYAASQKDRIDTKHEQFQVRYFFQPGETLDLTVTAYRSDFHRNWYKLDRVRATAGGALTAMSAILDDPATYGAEYAILTGATSPNDNALEVKANNRTYYAQGLQAILGLQSRNGQHGAEIGLRIHRDEADRFQWTDFYKMSNGTMMLTQAGVPGTESNRIETATAWAPFAQYKWRYDRFTFTPGLRYENIKIEREDFGRTDPARTGTNRNVRENKVGVWIPGAGLDYAFTPALSGFAGIHRGFAPPGSTVGAKSENSVNYEAGVRYRTEEISAQAVAYYNAYSNLLGADRAAAGGTGTGDLFNGGKAMARGLETGLMWNPGSRVAPGLSLPLRATYTYTHAEFRNDFNSTFEEWGTVLIGDELPYTPKHQFFISLGFAYGRYSADLSGKYQGAMRIQAGQGAIPATQRTDDFFVIDLAGEVAIVQGVRVFGGIRNITDAAYNVARRPAGLRPGHPRSVLTGIKADF